MDSSAGVIVQTEHVMSDVHTAVVTVDTCC